ncbi:chorismate mutase 1, chloroplastic-like isoform X2 [Glycine soja]|uniref:chorismate mutase n=1 Tax=Glycine max TaxID=3847 RepID=I1LWP3_SOYBN|nr:chorismate mutase 1, chloroplastic isoform X2 [Glycine max]XP_028198094.1 chorismate mutase 1, chloroplastic-like isoform X2 [Glycine soja]|eukprot:XP_014620773.1 chorismate mutase 1, chloroplastic isoform X2 [Glycine max]
MESKLLRATTISVPSTPSCAFHRTTRKASISFNPTSDFAPKSNLSLQAHAASIESVPTKKRIDESDNLTLDHIRRSLVRQEDSIIFSLIERAQYCYNEDTYDPDAFSMDGFHGSLVEYMVGETERLHAKVGRYKSPDEHPFFPDGLPEPVLPPLQYPQALSKRIHYGKYVAEAKYQASPDSYKDAIIAQDKDKLMELLTYPEVEEAIKRRVDMKTKTYGQELVVTTKEHRTEPVYKINPSLVADLYSDWIMPLTKEVQVSYLLRRLD